MKPTPGAAILWTVLVPGLAHLRLGHPLRGAAALVTTVAMFFAGWALVGDRMWYFQLFEPFSFLQPVLERVPVQMLPDSLNLGCTIVAGLLRDLPVTSDPQGMHDWLRSIRLPVAHEHLGLFLTGASGIVCALWAADAHWLAQPRRRVAPGPEPAWAAAVSWLLPGSGHVMLGQRDKGILVGAATLLMVGLGLWLSQGHGIDRPLRSAWWIGEVLFGGGTLFATLVTAPWEEGPPGLYLDHGVAICTVAGFMNLIVMIDAYTIAEERTEASR